MGGARDRSAGWWLVTGALVLVWGGVAAAFVHRPRGFPERGWSNEVAVVATLRHLAASQEVFREARSVDLDGDGLGEFGFLQELTAAAGVRADPGGATRGPALAWPLLSPSLRPWTRPDPGAPVPC